MWNAFGSANYQRNSGTSNTTKTGEYKEQRDYHKDFNQTGWDQNQEGVSNQLGNYFSNVGRSRQPYQGQMVASMSGNENMGQNRLGQYLGQQQPQMYGQAQQAVGQALTQNYKPIVDTAATEKLVQATRDQTLNQILPDIQRGIADNANLGGMYYSGKHGKMQQDAATDVASNLAQTIAQLRYQDEQAKRGVAMERENRALAAVQPALQTGQRVEEMPLRQAQAATAYGGLPRSIEQARQDSNYQEYLRTLSENNPEIAQALQYLSIMGNSRGFEDSTTKTTGSNRGWQYNDYQGSTYGGKGGAGMGAS